MDVVVLGTAKRLRILLAQQDSAAQIIMHGYGNSASRRPCRYVSVGCEYPERSKSSLRILLRVRRLAVIPHGFASLDHGGVSGSSAAWRIAGELRHR